MPPVLVAGGLLLGAVPDVAAAPDPIPPQAVTTTAACPAGPGLNPRANPRLNRACAEVAAYLEALNRAAVRLGQRSDVALGSACGRRTGRLGRRAVYASAASGRSGKGGSDSCPPSG